MTTSIKEAFTALCRKMAEETDIKKLEILKQQLRRLLEKAGEGEGEARISRRADGPSRIK